MGVTKGWEKMIKLDKTELLYYVVLLFYITHLIVGVIALTQSILGDHMMKKVKNYCLRSLKPVIVNLNFPLITLNLKSVSNSFDMNVD